MSAAHVVEALVHLVDCLLVSFACFSVKVSCPAPPSVGPFERIGVGTFRQGGVYPWKRNCGLRYGRPRYGRLSCSRYGCRGPRNRRLIRRNRARGGFGPWALSRPTKRLLDREKKAADHDREPDEGTRDSPERRRGQLIAMKFEPWAGPTRRLRVRFH
ncbi:MAG TPA: hypothetical protein VG125_33260 [Pirellulales bacterium]|nr:hypothetical protein [Pirellulales bacterium]